MRIDRRALVGASALLATAVPRVARAETDAKSNEEIARRYIDEVWNARNADAMDDLIAEDYEPSEPDNAPGREAFKQRFASAIAILAERIPDLKYVIDGMASTDDHVLFRGRLTGNSKSGKKLEAMYFSDLLIAEGKIRTEWNVTDQQAFYEAAI